MINFKTSIGKIKWLMIISQILLFLFVSYWLYTRFISERDRLYQSILHSYKEVQRQIIDSSLFQIIHSFDTTTAIINCNPNYSKNNILHYYANDSFPQSQTSDIKIDEKSQIQIKKTNKIVELKKNDSDLYKNFNSNHKKNITIKMAFDADSLLAQNNNFDLKETSAVWQFKTLIFNINDLLKKTISYDEKTAFIYNPEKDDSVVVKSRFNKALTQINSLLQLKTNLHQLNHKLNNNQKNLQNSVSFYNWVIISHIIPQLIFALILLLFTGIAFIMAHHFIVRQIKLDLLKNNFISNVSHEMRTPISTVKVAIEAILKYDMDLEKEKAKEYLQMAWLEMDRLENFSNKILNTYIIQTGKFKMQFEEVSINEIIEEVILSQKIHIEKRNATVTFVKKNDFIQATADKLHLQGVLINLIDNAIKFSKEKALIEITSEVKNYDVHISVKDNGPGIPENYKDKIFDRFFRVPEGNQHNSKGFGLGLFYASEIVKLHQGKITYDSNINGGSIFKIVFPKEIINP